jgi:hypothetical protein
MDGIDDIGIPLYVDDQGNVSPIVSTASNYKELLLLTEYFPVLELHKEIPDTVLDLEEMINIAVVYIVSAHSTIAETRKIHADAERDYINIRREMKRIASDRHTGADYNLAFRTPFQKQRKTRHKDF